MRGSESMNRAYINFLSLNMGGCHSLCAREVEIIETGFNHWFQKLVKLFKLFIKR